ncbi:hypothetical protein GBZ48_13180 [Azospirillum melinis]|uniref:Uncharacterized protein n=1 Tax=Azospirillum melinis TaxID=328839 RepID=A0ABX2KCI2_9PROT|nr:hypothetical protein [Azospirillum melinis]MBP2306301.1 hypothetical protein [Azospirillum melinis]NUB00241.1 hypothetical protein [Azospirillum melinis]
MDDFPDDEQLRAAQERVRRAAEAVADAYARLARHDSEAAAQRLRVVRAWWASRQGADGDRR